MAAFRVDQLIDFARAAGFTGEALEQAVAIALAETGGNSEQSGYVDPKTGKREQSFGVTQINVPSHPGYNAQQLLADPVYAFKAMYDISQGGQNFNAWTTWSGATPAGKANDAHKLLPQVRQALGVSGSGSTAPPSTDPNNSDDGALQQAFGYASHLADIPELKNVLDQAVAHRWDPATIDAAVRNTDWARAHNQNQVNWELQKRLHPADAQADLTRLKMLLQDQATKDGFPIEADRLDAMANWAKGLGMTDAQAQTMAQREYKFTPGSAPAGQSATLVADMKAKAKKYMVPVSDTAIDNWATKVVQGLDTEDSFEQYLRDQAKSMFPQLAGMLDAHDTSTLLDPYAQIAGTELGLPSTSIDFTDPKYLGALMPLDPKTGIRTMPTLDQWRTTLRTDPKYGWGDTTNAQNMAADLGEQLLKGMGSV